MKQQNENNSLKVGIRFGEPIFPEGKNVDEMTALVGEKIFSLKENIDNG